MEEAYAVINGSTTPEPSYSGSGAWKGFIFPWISAPYIYTDDIAYGFYKLTYIYNTQEMPGSGYFYIDIRDCKNAGGSTSPCIYYNPDFFIKYYNDDDLFKWKAPGGIWTTISTGEVLRVWEIKNGGTPPTTSEFEDFWDHALVLLNDEDTFARIVWTPHPSFNTTHFKVYRATNSSPTPPPPQNFSLIATVSSSTYDFTDNNFLIGGGSGYAHYFVKAYNSGSGTYSSATNTVSASGILYDQKIALGNSGKDQPLEFSLEQNYPNPFNPTTTITYSIPKDGLVSLKIFDILGKEATILFNKHQLAGYYEIEFNAADLLSGIYFYTLTSGNFTATKKLILLK